jgi:ParD-like antitoxin of type II bacterial toxin-antitoxin system
MSMAVKLSDDLVEEAREEAKAADRSITSQIEHWARLGRQIEHLLRHDDMLSLKRAATLPPPTRRAVLAAIRRIALQRGRRDLAETIAAGRTVYQAAGNGRVERIEPDGTRTIGRFVNRRFTADEPQRASRRR